MKALNRQVIVAVSNETTPTSFDLSEETIGLNLSESQKEVLQKQLREMTNTFLQQAQRNVETGRSIGDFGTGFTSVIPYRLSEGTSAQELAGESKFKDVFKAQIVKRLKDQARDRDNPRFNGTLL